jgi:Calpain family cysteine protease
VHVDNCVPCNLIGKPLFCESTEGEILGSLLEKAYAKLHGCYEALTHGLIESAFGDFSSVFTTRVFRFEQVLTEDTACDVIWDAIENGLVHNDLVGCTRTIPYPYSEPWSNRGGLALDSMYCVMDAAVVETAASSDYDALTVGMICVCAVRALQGEDVYSGRWSRGHPLWGEYPLIQQYIRDRTKLIAAKHRLSEEYCELRLFWMQVEDFVDSFNRLYVVRDQTLQTDFTKTIAHDFTFTSKEERDVFSLQQYLVNEEYPVYSFRVTDTARCSFKIAQKDERWSRSEGRGSSTGETYFWSQLKTSGCREDFLMRSMCYTTAIGIAVISVDESFDKVLQYSAGGVVATSDSLVLGPVNGVSAVLEPGVYTVVPLLYCKDISEHHNQAMKLLMCMDSVNVTYDVNISSSDCRQCAVAQEVHCFAPEEWEWREDSEVLGVSGMYDELAALVSSCRNNGGKKGLE